MPTNTDDYEWLGIVYPDDVKPKVALMTPLAFYDDTVWNAIKRDDAFYYFPNNGKVAVFGQNIPISKIGRLCYFQVKRNPHLTNPEEARHSHYLVSGELKLESLAQILHWTSRAKETFDLPDLLERGVKVTDCFSQNIYIHYRDHLYGPIRLERVADQLRPVEYTQSSHTRGQPLLVSVFKMPEYDILPLGEIPNQVDFLDENALESPIQQEDWSQPQVVIKRVLKASNEDLPELEKDAHLVDKRLSALVRLSSSDGSPALHIERATLERAQYILSQQMESLHELPSLIEELSTEHPLLKAAREQELRLWGTEIEQQAEVRIQSQMDRFNKLECEVQEVQELLQSEQARLRELNDHIQKAEERRDQSQKELEVFEQEMQQQLERLREEPLRVLAELQITSSLFPILGQKGSYANELTAQQTNAPAPVPHRPIAEQSLTIADAVAWITDDNTETVSSNLGEVLSNFWVRVAQQAEVKSKDVKVCVAAVLARLIPLVKGQAAMFLIRSVAQAMASGRVWSVPIPLTAMAPLDLFGMIDPERQMFIPAAGGLADIILQARKHPQELALVILEGIDRVPGMPVYVPLLRQYIERQQGDSAAILPSSLNLFHPRALAPDDPYLELARFTWPSNLLLMVMCDSDINSLPLPSICNPWFAHLEAEHNAGNSSPYPASTSHVSWDLWQQWIQEICRKAMGNSNNQGILDQRQWIFRNALMMLKVSNPDEVVEQVCSQHTQQDADIGVKETY